MINSEFVKVIEVERVDDLFYDFSINGKYFELIKTCIFRGKSRFDYELRPTLLRERTINELLSRTENISKGYNEDHLIKAEFDVLSSFYRYANKCGLYIPEGCRCFEHLNSNWDLSMFFGVYVKEKWLPKDLYELAALSQHYGLPTRLIDWSSLWKTALYFAVVGTFAQQKLDDSKYFVLWALDTSEVFNFTFQNHEFPLKIIRPLYRNNDNLRAQNGLFTLWEIEKPYHNFEYNSKEEADEAFKNWMRPIERRPLDELLNDYLSEYYNKHAADTRKPVLYRFLIPTKYNRHVFTQLFYDGVNGSTLFPGYYGVKKVVDEIHYIEDNHRHIL